ncbi:MAG: O-linked N-acetylglucosamine transferase family protein, partial [Devosia sp.]
HANLGLALLHKGETVEAIAAFRRAIALRPDYAFAYNHLAGALRAAGEGAEARAAAERAVALQPLYAAAHNTLGQNLVDLGEREAAVEAFRRALQIRPDAGGYQNLSVTLSQLGRTREAIAAARTGLKLAPDDLPLLVAMADAQASARQYGFALPFLRRAIALRPDDPDLVGRLGHVLVNGGFLHEGVERLRAFYERSPDELSGRQTYVFALNYLAEAGAREIAAEAFRYGELLTRRIPPAMSHANDPDPGRRLRVGFVSGDFENHPVARFLEPTCRSIDPAAFELFAYKTSLTADEMTARLQQLIPNWREVALTRDEALARMIAADRIDILFDLSGFSTRSRLGVFARKPAPIAVTWLGYFATTGLSTIDYVLASPWVIPVGEEDQWIEKPWRLPETYLCFARPGVEVPVGPLPMLRNGFLTFGSASNVNKISDRTARCWGALLRAVPRSRLLLRSGTLGNPRVASELRARLEAAGVPGDRITLEKPVVDYGAHLARYNEIDIALDPFPYAGATTTMEALWMGVPVLTLRGDRYVSHMGENIHHNVGLTDWIADDADDYVRKATAFAADHEKLGALRDGLRARVEASPMMDAPRFARHFEAALREMWRIWCRDRAAQPG